MEKADEKAQEEIEKSDMEGSEEAALEIREKWEMWVNSCIEDEKERLIEEVTEKE